MAETWGLNNTLMCRSLRAADYDKDGFTDLYVVNINNVNHFFKNEGGQGFTNVYGRRARLTPAWGWAAFSSTTTTTETRISTDARCEPNEQALPQQRRRAFNDFAFFSGLNYKEIVVDVADINHDGWLDLYITDLYPSAMFSTNAMAPSKTSVCLRDERFRYDLGLCLLRL